MKFTRSLVAAAGAAALIAMPATAHAVDLTYDYDVEGTSHIASTDSDLWIKPTSMEVTSDTSTNAITGHLPLKDADTKFHVAGFLPVKATVSFIEAAPLEGQLTRVGRNLAVTSTASYYVKLSDVLVAGIPAFAGDNCRTKKPVVISANTPDGERFDLSRGGRLVGEYTLGAFQNCNLNTGLINLLVPGSGNTVELNVSNGVVRQ